MLAPTFEIDERAVIAHFEALPDALLAELRPAVERLAQEMLRRARAGEHERTGALRAATVERVEESRDFIRGLVAVEGDRAKAGALEYGAHRAFPVAAHAMGLDHAWAQAIAPELVAVALYHRHANVAAEHFLADAEGAAVAPFRAAVEAAVAAVLAR